MHKNTIWLFVITLIVYLTLVYCEEVNAESLAVDNSGQDNALQGTSRQLMDEEARTRRRHGLHRWMWGWHALAIAYWIKVKVIIVAFFVGSAIFVGLRYFWPNGKCGRSEVIHESPIIYDHPPSYHHDHIPYSLSDHSSSSSFEPYSAYAPSGFSDVVDSPGESIPHEIKKRSAEEDQARQRRPVFATEEQIADMMFYFLGLDSKACRRRFICEMEFRSRLHPLSSMAFRIVGRAFFEKYTNARNELGHAKSFDECAAVNAECVFIEQNETEQAELSEAEAETETEQTEIVQNDLDVPEANSEEQTSNDTADSESLAENEDNEVAPQNLEQQNAHNLKVEKRLSKLRRRGDRMLNPVALRILSQAPEN